MNATELEVTVRDERRRPPYSEDAEIAVLSAMLIDQAAVVRALDLLDESMFYREGHRRIFRACKELHRNGAIVDPVTLSEELERTGSLQAAGGREYLGVVMIAVPTSANIEYHAKIIIEKANRRRIIELARAAELEAHESALSVDQITDGMTKALVGVAVSKRAEAFVDVKDLVWPFMERLDDISAGKRAVGLRTGYPELDDKLHGGFQPGEFVIVAGVPNSGKTGVMLNLLLNAAMDYGTHVALVSAEMGREGIMGRLFANVADVPATKFRKGNLDAMENHRLAMASVVLHGAPFAIDDTAMPDLEDVVAKVRIRKARDPELAMVGVDFIQLIQARAERGELGESVLRRISYTLKGLAKELGIVVMATCQPNDKQIEDREDKRPTLRDLQGSAGMRQAADLAMLLYRPGQYAPGMGPSNDTLELNVPKARDLPVFRVNLKWDGAYQRLGSPMRDGALEAIRKHKDRPLKLEVE